MKKYDIAAFIWPSYTGKEDRSLIFWPDGEGELQTVRRATKKCDDHILPRIPARLRPGDDSAKGEKQG